MDTEVLEVGRNAFAGRAWLDAYDHLAMADRASPLAPEDLERLATAAYLTGHDAESTDTWIRAHRARLEHGDHREAVRCAFWLGFGLVQRGEMAQGGGWLARAGSLVEQHHLDGLERGYLLLPDGLMAMGAGETTVALEQFEEVRSLARRFDDPDLSALATLGRGEAFLRLGRIREGMRLFDEAMVSVTADETSPTVSGIVYCAVIEACQHVSDLPRAREWTTALDRWCHGQRGLVPYRGQCLVHRSQILQAGGKWTAALAEAELARTHLADPPHPAIGMAHYQLGELHRLRGEFAAAEDAYRHAHACGRDPQPGLALLRLAEGRHDAAVTAIDAAIDGAHDQVMRVQLLPAYAEIMAAVGRHDEAQAAADELEVLAGAGNLVHGAVAAHTRGAVLLAAADPGAALEPLRDALHAWQDLEAPFEAAQTRVLLAVACRAVDDHDRAQMECDAARRVFEELGAAPALARLDQLVSGTPRTPPVTARELEVLRLVAHGHTNREIADALVISEKTVERHLANIFTRIGVSNRAAATAFAYDHHLL
jgi:ATP/maltotriose-dependent transcriptional regulator MalT